MLDGLSAEGAEGVAVMSPPAPAEVAGGVVGISEAPPTAIPVVEAPTAIAPVAGSEAPETLPTQPVAEAPGSTPTQPVAEAPKPLRLTTSVSTVAGPGGTVIPVEDQPVARAGNRIQKEWGAAGAITTTRERNYRYPDYTAADPIDHENPESFSKGVDTLVQRMLDEGHYKIWRAFQDGKSNQVICDENGISLTDLRNLNRRVGMALSAMRWERINTNADLPIVVREDVRVAWDVAGKEFATRDEIAARLNLTAKQFSDQLRSRVGLDAIDTTPDRQGLARRGFVGTAQRKRLYDVEAVMKIMAVPVSEAAQPQAVAAPILRPAFPGASQVEEPQEQEAIA